MFLPTKLTDKELRDYSDEHVKYEARLMLIAGTLMPTIPKGNNYRDYGIDMAVIECFAIHVRNLIDFFYYAIPVGSTDLVAGHFFDDWEKNCPPISPTLRAAKRRANKEVAHLTTERIAGAPSSKAWDPATLMPEIRQLLDLFVKGASPTRLGPVASRMLQELAAKPVDLATAI